MVVLHDGFQGNGGQLIDMIDGFLTLVVDDGWWGVIVVAGDSYGLIGDQRAVSVVDSL